jgi:hypothetical protein
MLENSKICSINKIVLHISLNRNGKGLAVNVLYDSKYTIDLKLVTHKSYLLLRKGILGNKSLSVTI